MARTDDSMRVPNRFRFWRNLADDDEIAVFQGRTNCRPGAVGPPVRAGQIIPLDPAVQARLDWFKSGCQGPEPLLPAEDFDDEADFRPARALILECLRESGPLTIPEIQEKIGRAESRVYNALRRLRESGRVHSTGQRYYRGEFLKCYRIREVS